MDRPSIDYVLPGKVWDFNEPNVVQAQIIQYAKALEREGFEARWPHWEKEQPESKILCLSPAFNMIGGKARLRSRALLADAAAREAIVIIWTCDVEILKEYSGFVGPLNLVHGLATNFMRHYKYWRPVHQFHDYQPKPFAVEWFCPCPPVRPKFEVGYVGGFKAKRWTVLKGIDYPSMVMIGPGFDKQDVFRAVRTDVRTPYPYMGELYSLCAWQMCCLDSELGAVCPAVYRMEESWSVGRPCMFHKTVVESRPDLKAEWGFCKEKGWIVETSDDIHRCSRIGLRFDGEYDIVELARIAREQKAMLGTTYYGASGVSQTVKGLDLCLAGKAFMGWLGVPGRGRVDSGAEQ